MIIPGPLNYKGKFARVLWRPGSLAAQAGVHTATRQYSGFIGLFLGGGMVAEGAAARAAPGSRSGLR